MRRRDWRRSSAGRSTASTGSRASLPKICSALRGSSSPWAIPRPNGFIFPSSGTRNRRGTICGFGRPPISGSTGPTSIRRSNWAMRYCTTTLSCRRISNSTERLRRRPSTRQRRNSSWRKQATPTASTPARFTATQRSRMSVRRWPTAWARSASARTCGRSNGLDAGPLYCDAAFANVGEAMANSLGEVGIRANLRPIERAAFYKSFSEKKYNGLIMGGSAAFGNAATRLEAFAVNGGAYAYGNYPDIDALFQQQAGELDHAKREALLFQIQQLVQKKVIAAPLWQLAALSGVGPRIGEAMIGAIAGDPWTSPYEDMTLKSA